MIERALRQADHLRADADARGLRSAFRSPSCRVCPVAEHVRARYAAFFEQELARAARAYAEVVFFLAGASNTIEKRLLDDRRQPNFGLNFSILTAKGEYAGVSMHASKYAVCTEHGPQTLDTEPLYQGTPTD